MLETSQVNIFSEPEQTQVQFLSASDIFDPSRNENTSFDNIAKTAPPIPVGLEDADSSTTCSVETYKRFD